jgi:hypothetical protein
MTVHNESQRIWKELIMAYLRYYPDISWHAESLFSQYIIFDAIY